MAEILFTPDGLTAEGIELLRKCISMSVADKEDLRLANTTLDAIQQSLAHRKPFIGDHIRVERGEFVRGSGESICTVCGQKIYDHPSVPAYSWLRRHCNGNLIKV